MNPKKKKIEKKNSFLAGKNSPFGLEKKLHKICTYKNLHKKIKKNYFPSKKFTIALMESQQQLKDCLGNSDFSKISQYLQENFPALPISIESVFKLSYDDLLKCFDSDEDTVNTIKPKLSLLKKNPKKKKNNFSNINFFK